MIWQTFEDKEAEAVEQIWQKKMTEISRLWVSPASEFPSLPGKLILPMDQIFIEDYDQEYADRRVVETPSDWHKRKILPSNKGNRKICYDFGRQICGYFAFIIKAEEGVIIDLILVEYITPDGTIQHTMPFNRYGMRYITKKGINKFTSLKHRSGQYLFVTIRNQKSVVEIEAMKIIESTAPVRAVQTFQCSDSALEQICKISERTLQLCMEDTFTDCPLYVQTLWIGDARNDALHAYTVYGNYDVSAHSLELGALFSFGGQGFLRKLWPAVLKNLEGADSHKDEKGLFSAPF